MPYRSTRRFAWLAAALLLAAAAQPALAQWKWRDAQGRVTVSDLPPPRGVPDKDILQRPEAQKRAAPPPEAPAVAPATAAAAASAPAAVDKDLEAKKRAADQERAAKAKAEDDKLAAQRAENCTRARQHLALLDSGQRVVRMNDKGEREFIDDATRAAEARRAREVIASDCR